ncbi:uncharacterized protein K452DRAFT_297179 [Aplosporella prunicola CBS 121167]|uniref:Uncharacterized protein n=1 Tax=Aplosporella prunicola CBS 121167 TaxID=1176127 RepID=A0A6A6BJ59_9PEZI|nr:uncharacterized protein K452DRAFT_297179 [Aplosporella prunicola CBS 121167]KAF2143443.1 hypothetical protein K452DRAFT_297179 [Aplosporella prunicola CBS 121167]
MPPVRTHQQIPNKAFKPPSRVGAPSVSKAPPARPTATVAKPAGAASKTTTNTSARPGFKPATSIVSSPEISDIEDADASSHAASKHDDIEDEDDKMNDSSDDSSDVFETTAAEHKHAHRPRQEHTHQQKQQRRPSEATAAPAGAGAAVPPASQDAPTVAPPIPAKLLNKLLHEGFEDEEMRIGREAMAVAGKYVETFVREALARAMFERRDVESEMGERGDGFLQVEDLERLAPQLLLDF